jgi:hypothetical protein
MTTSVIERNASIGFLGLLTTVAGLFVLPWFLPIPTVLSVGLGIFGFVLTLFEWGIYSLFAGGLVAWSLFTLVLTSTAMPDAPDLKEPIPVPTGHGFELDPDSTNVEHMYDSRPMPPNELNWQPSRSSITTSTVWRRHGRSSSAWRCPTACR